MDSKDNDGAPEPGTIRMSALRSTVVWALASWGIAAKCKSAPNTPHAVRSGNAFIIISVVGAGKVTPYSMGATDAFDMVYNGGKEDDITVVVARFEGEFVTGGERGLGRHGL